MDFANFALYGLSILFIIYLYFLYKNLKENSLIIFGSLLITVGFFFAVKEKYDHLYKPQVKKNNIIMSHLLLGTFLLLSFVFPEINRHVKKTNIFGLVGHFILLNSNFGYKGLGYICLTIYYSIYTYRNGMKESLIEKMQGVGGGLVLLYYIKKTIDNWYTKKEKEIIGHHN
jgi:hypothetical protein